MQALAAELALSETAFLLPARERGDARIRIFTPRVELAFAGHPVLGAAVALGHGREEVTLETQSGPVSVALRHGPRSTFGRMGQPIPTWRAFEREAELLAALGVERSGLPVEAYRNGPEHVFVALDSEGEVAKLEPDLRALAALGELCVSCFAGAGHALQDAHVRARAGCRRGPRDRLGGRPARRSPRPPRADRLRRGDRAAPGRRDRPPVAAVCERARRGRGRSSVSRSPARP